MKVGVVETPAPSVVYVVERGEQGLSAAAAWLLEQNNPSLTEEDFYIYIASLVPNNGSGGGVSSSVVKSFQAGMTISGHTAVRLVAGKLQTASVDDLSQADTCIGLAVGSGQAGGLVDVCLSGYQYEVSWNWKPGPIFIGLNGLLTQTPIRSAYEQRVGIAAGPTAMLVDVEAAYIFAQ